MKAAIKSKPPARKQRAAGVRPRSTPSTPLSDEEFRRQLHTELADEIRTAQESLKKSNAALFRRRTPAEAKANAAAARAMFAEWEKADHKDPPPSNDWEKFKALLEENRMRSAPLFSE